MNVQLGSTDRIGSGFVMRLLTRCQTPLIAGGLCEAGYEAQSRRDLQNLTAIDFRQTLFDSQQSDASSQQSGSSSQQTNTSPLTLYNIDYILAKVVRESCGPYVWAVGVTASLHDTPLAASAPLRTEATSELHRTAFTSEPPRTGGIIGSPHMEITSASAQVEHIGNGLIMRAFPGGPGCVAMCDDENILARFDISAYAQSERAEALASFLREQNVKTFFIVSDGTGQDATGTFIYSPKTPLTSFLE